MASSSKHYLSTRPKKVNDIVVELTNHSVFFVVVLLSFFVCGGSQINSIVGMLTKIMSTDSGLLYVGEPED